MIDYRLIITVYSDKEHPPINFKVIIPEALARILMATPVKACSLAVESHPGIIEDKSRLVEFK